MKTKWSLGFIAVLAVVAGNATASVSMDFVTIGNPGNAPHEYTWGSTFYSWGSVNYTYNMGKYEVTAGQWADFTSSSSLHVRPANDRNQFDSDIWTGTEKPAVNITWYEAAQFCNWMSSGSTWNGVYQFDGLTGDLTGVDRSYRNVDGVAYALPSIHEWYKAAYYKPDNTGYALYANGTLIAPVEGVDANYKPYPNSADVWDVGTGSVEQNGTEDMMGNVWEWIEDAKDGLFDSSDETIGLIGGASHWVQASQLESGKGYPQEWYAGDGTSFLGFRVVELDHSVIPEPATILMLGFVSGGAFVYRRWFV